MANSIGMRTPEAMEALTRALADVLRLPVKPEWLPSVAQQLAITLALADALEAVEVGDETSAAPVYRL